MKRVAVTCLVAAALAACAVDPVQPPQIPSPPQYTATPVEVPQLAPGQDIPAAWWQLFQSPALDGLVRRALDSSPTLARARARLTQAQEDLNARAGATQYPRLDAKLSANRVEVHPQSLGVPALPVPMPFNLYLASVGVSYTFDFFGANRHELEALRAELDHRGFELEAARLMLAGNVVTTAIREAALREQVAQTEEIVVLQERQAAIIERLEQIGTVSRADVAAQRRDLAQSRAGLPELRRQLEQARHRLAIYVGEAPGSAQLPEFRLAELRLPAQLPLSLPSELARQRPDIRASQALLAQAGARVGVATANLYPQFTLSATAGSLTSHAGDLLTGGTEFYLLGASLAQPLFHGGELQARRRAAVAAYEQAGAAYKETLLQGFREVADVLRALEADERKLRERSEAADQARRVADIASGRFQAGGVSAYAVLDSQRKLHTALLERTQAIADRHADAAALLQALGGGWEAAR
jgi:NodT family efflux transporter outer membrane factor (OMF) lipoprotein